MDITNLTSTKILEIDLRKFGDVSEHIKNLHTYNFSASASSDPYMGMAPPEYRVGTPQYYMPMGHGGYFIEKSGDQLVTHKPMTYFPVTDPSAAKAVPHVAKNHAGGAEKINAAEQALQSVRKSYLDLKNYIDREVSGFQRLQGMIKNGSTAPNATSNSFAWDVRPGDPNMGEFGMVTTFTDAQGGAVAQAKSILGHVSLLKTDVLNKVARAKGFVSLLPNGVMNAGKLIPALALAVVASVGAYCAGAWRGQDKDTLAS